MDQGKRKLATALLAAASLTAVATSAHAIVYTESPDAGQTVATAQATATAANPAGTALTAINGTIAGTNGLDADLFYINITNTSTFSATASSTMGTGATTTIDTSLFLFTSAGVPVIANDDNPLGTTTQSVIPAGNSLLITLSPGRYILGIALSGNEPTNSANQLLFTTDQPTTNVRGPATGVNPTTLNGFSVQTADPEGGSYSISLVSATFAIPEPSTNVALALGGLASCALLRRFRRQQTVA